MPLNIKEKMEVPLTQILKCSRNHTLSLNRNISSTSSYLLDKVSKSISGLFNGSLFNLNSAGTYEIKGITHYL